MFGRLRIIYDQFQATIVFQGDRIELAAVDATMREQLRITAIHHEATAYVANPLAISAPEFSNRLEVWREAAD